MANARLLPVLVPGVLLIAIGAALVNVSRGAGAVIVLVGLLLLVAWPAFTLVVEVRCSWRQKRGLEIPVRLARTRQAIGTIQAVTMMVVLSAVMLGGLGVYCLLTTDADPEQRVWKIAVGVGPLVLAAVPLLFFTHGRSALMHRVAGLGLMVLGAGGLGAVAYLVRQGRSDVGDLVMLVASIVTTAAGLWLAVTGRNRIRRG